MAHPVTGTDITIKLAGQNWCHDDLELNNISHNLLEEPAETVLLGFQQQAVLATLPSHARNYFASLEVPIHLTHTSSTGHAILAICEVFPSISEVFTFSSPTTDTDAEAQGSYTENQELLIVSRVLSGIVGGTVPMFGAHLSEAALDALHLSALIDNFVSIGSSQYNKDTNSQRGFYFDISGTTYRHTLKPDIELSDLGVGRFFVEHKISHKGGERGPDRIKLAWELFRSFSVKVYCSPLVY